MTPGYREERSYPLTERQIKNLAQGGLVVTFFFSLSGLLLGAGIDIHKDLDLNKDIPAVVAASWTAYRAAAFAGAAIFGVIGLILAASGFNQIEEVKAQTKHQDDLPPYEQKSLPKVAVVILLAVVTFVVGLLIRPYLW